MPEPTFQIAAAVSLAALLFFLAWLLFAAARSTPPVKSLVDIDGRNYVVCSPGQCAVSLTTGVKRCPATLAPILAAADAEVCSATYACDSPVLPYAVGLDYGTSAGGLCPPGVRCSCLNHAQCPEYVLAGFQTTTGTPFQAIPGQRLSFQQFISADASSALVVGNPATQFCAIPPDWLTLATPGCPGFKSGDPASLAACMGLAAGCGSSGNSGQAVANACARGVLALLPQAPPGSFITATDLLTAQVGCVRGVPCPCGQMAVWDQRFGGVVCKSLN